MMCIKSTSQAFLVLLWYSPLPRRLSLSLPPCRLEDAYGATVYRKPAAFPARPPLCAGWRGRVIISRYIVREIVVALLAVTGVLYVIYVSNRFIRLLADTEGVTLPADAVVQLLALKSLSNLVTLLPLALFFAVLIALGRMYKDNEIVALAACGVSSARVLRTVLWCAFAFAGVVAGISLYAGPWAEEKAYQLQDELKTTADTRGLTAGRFREIRDGKLVFYIEALSDGGRVMKNVFVETKSAQGIPNVLAAEQAYFQVNEESGDRYLVLENGHRYEGQPGDAQFKIIKFRRHGVLVEERALVSTARKTVAHPTPVLLARHDAADIAELQWRVSMPLATILLAALAVPLSRTTPRQGRYGKLIVAVVGYVAYMNLLVASRSWIEHGKVSPLIGVWWVHALLLLLVIGTMMRQLGVRWRRPALGAA